MEEMAGFFLNDFADKEPVVEPPKTKEDLQRIGFLLTGLRIPDNKVCIDHVSPMQAISDAFFCETPISVWHASRGFGAKSISLAYLSYLESIIQGASVSLLGGSGEQSERVHGYITGTDTNLPDSFWSCPTMPLSVKHLLLTDPTKKETNLSNGGKIRVLMASQTSVRGPHPQKLRLDECDEMPLKILDASLGQPMSARGIPIQIVMSSTHHNPNGTMTEILKRAKDKSWPIYRWCYKENLVSNGGWLEDRDVEVRRTTYTDFSWKAEIELQEPSPESRAIMTDKVDAMFSPKLGRFIGSPEEYIEIETPQENARYATGADWAQKRDWTVIATFRTDCEPARLVAFRRTGRKPWSEMIGYFDQQVKRFKGNAAHDNTGVGNVVRDIMKVKSRPIELSQKMKFLIVTSYIKAIEDGKIVCPAIEYVYQEHKYATRNDIIGTGHLPDTICAMAIAWHTRNRNSWARGSNG